ncbi:outer dense fiber protein 3-B-like [Spodoptera litura]|uniref:Outer dense fiber protein 3-B-like n=1 Tax=Spodoptera litura TaxID=69820 RepID=A0A9J7EJ85_SPOLT|nr:outer dense fiber protein 3-B-like [Spodoptera litura]
MSKSGAPMTQTGPSESKPTSTVPANLKSTKGARTSSSLSKTWQPCESPMGVRQNPWTPTTRRGPIAAEASSPGPAVVSLPSLIGKPPQESRRPRAPAFTFGHKLDPPGTTTRAGPGPATYNTEGMTAKGRWYFVTSSHKITKDVSIVTISQFRVKSMPLNP